VKGFSRDPLPGSSPGLTNTMSSACIARQTINRNPIAVRRDTMGFFRREMHEVIKECYRLRSPYEQSV
jgi:hypothetical protein